MLYVKIVDAYKAAYGVDDPHFAITQLAQTTMRTGQAAVGREGFEDFLSNVALVEWFGIDDMLQLGDSELRRSQGYLGTAEPWPNVRLNSLGGDTAPSFTPKPAWLLGDWQGVVGEGRAMRDWEPLPLSLSADADAAPVAVASVISLPFSS